MDISLKGLRILNTRPLEQGKTWSLAIERAGGVSLELPVLSIEPVPSTWVTTLPDLTRVDQAIFISTNAVNACFNALKEQHINWPSSIQVIAIGKSTANCLTEQGIHVHFVPDIADSEHLLTLPCFEQLSGKTVLLFKGEGGRPLIEETLITRGARLVALPVYKRGLPHYAPEFLDIVWQNDPVDIILLTSETAIENIFTLFQTEAARNWLCNKPCLVISERLAQKAAAMGMKTITHIQF